MALGLGAAVTIAAAVLLVAVLQRDTGTFEVDARRDMLLERERVALLEGFGQRTKMEVWHDAQATNPDRDEIGIVLGRESRLRWRVAARGGVFRAKVARLMPRPVPAPGASDTPLGRAVELAADELPLQVSVAGARFTEGEGELRGPSSSGGPERDDTTWFEGRDRVADLPAVVVDVPGAAAQSAVVPLHWHEGPAREIELALPDGAEVIEIRVTSPAGFPQNAAVLLLSPRVEMKPIHIKRESHPLHYRETTARLLASVKPVPPKERIVRMGKRFTETTPDAEGEWVFEGDVDALVSFGGRTGRPAIALAGQSSLDLAVDINAGTTLETALALDDRLAPGTSVTLEVLVDQELVATEVIDSIAWRDVAIPLGKWAGIDRTLTLRIGTSSVAPGRVPRQEVDFVQIKFVTVDYELTAPRIGLANPVLSEPASRPRREATPTTPSVIIVHVETLRADVLPMYGGKHKDLTPNLDLLADRSVVWDVAIAPSPWTAPSTATLFTGLPPAAHGVVDHHRMVLPASVPTLPERARAHGIPSGVFIANDILTGEAGFSRGATSYVELPYFNARQVTALAEGFLDNHVGQQFLLVLHYWDPHHHFLAPEGWRDRYVEPALQDHDFFGASARLVNAMGAGETVAMDAPDVRALRQRYLGDIAYLDTQMGRLFEALEERGIDDSTVVIFTSDHGEEFFEHGMFGHGSNVYDESLRVPLMIDAPGGQFGPARRVPEVVGTGGIHATVLEMLGIDASDDALIPALTFRDEGLPHAVGETRKGIANDGRGDPLRREIFALRTNDHLLIRRHPVASEGADAEIEYTLYDLTINPEATQPLAAPEVRPAFGEAKKLLEAADDWAEQNRASGLAPGLGSDTLDTLKRIGYIDIGDDGDKDEEGEGVGAKEDGDAEKDR